MPNMTRLNDAPTAATFLHRSQDGSEASFVAVLVTTLLFVVVMFDAIGWGQTFQFTAAPAFEPASSPQTMENSAPIAMHMAFLNQARGRCADFSGKSSQNDVQMNRQRKDELK